LEFGVAAGAASRHWLSEINNPDLKWHGFDVFTGLPEAWTRGGVEFAEQGMFDAGGTPPDIRDPRVTWHVGLVEDTLPKLDLDINGALCVLLDFDLYGPTAFALNWLAERLKAGDLLYFDEAYDPWHERRAIDEFLDAGHRVRAIGATGIALMLEYERFEPPA
jgi:O-methyltransferase